MVVKIYISGISGNKEVKKRQQRVLMILDSKSIKYEVIDITEPGRETDKDFMQNNAKSSGGTVSDPNPRSPLPPQMFNGDEYCGDYDQFDLANEVDTLEQFLKLEIPPEEPAQVDVTEEKTVNGVEGEKSKESSQEKEITDAINTEDNADKVEETVTPAKDSSPVKESTPVREGGASSKEGTPAADEKEVLKEGSPAKEPTPDRQKSVEKEPSEKAESPAKEVEAVETKKESSPVKEDSVNENGTVSSREQSEEKDPTTEGTENAERTKENISEQLIQSEQAASAE